MSAFDDEIRAAKAEIRKVMFSDARLERSLVSGVDRVAGTKGSKTTKNLDCVARLGKKTIKAPDGTVSTRFEAKIDVEPLVGDILNYEGKRWRVTEIIESAPDGVADQWKVVVEL